jgi:hypothetical protein
MKKNLHSVFSWIQEGNKRYDKGEVFHIPEGFSFACECIKCYTVSNDSLAAALELFSKSETEILKWRRKDEAEE